MNTTLRSYVTVTDMARAVGLSRSRFYSLIGSVFPEPAKAEFSSRRYYDEEGQRQCLEIRRNNRGLNGMPILFQSKSLHSKSPKRSAKPKVSKYESLIAGLSALGLSGISEKSIEQAIKSCFSEGISGIDEETILRQVFVELSNSLPE